MIGNFGISEPMRKDVEEIQTLKMVAMLKLKDAKAVEALWQRAVEEASHLPVRAVDHFNQLLSKI